MVIIFDTEKRTAVTNGQNMNPVEREVFHNLYIDLCIQLDKNKPETQKILYREDLKNIPLEN